MTSTSSKAVAAVEGRSDAIPRVQKRALRAIARKTTRGVAASLYAKDRKLALAVSTAVGELLDELPAEQRGTSARALAETVVLTRMRRDLVAAIVIQLGPYVINKKKRAAYPIVRELSDLDRLLADLLRQWGELRFDSDIENRLEALEHGRTIIDGTKA